jgi:hypothetical protein
MNRMTLWGLVFATVGILIIWRIRWVRREEEHERQRLGLKDTFPLDLGYITAWGLLVAGVIMLVLGLLIPFD